jgi:microcystin-dependent protein
MADAYLGEIRIFGGNYAPEGWLLCNGQSLSISQYEALYALIGVVYGGDGVNTFNVPNLQGVLAIGRGQPAGSPNNYQLGQFVGTYQVAVQANQLAPHSHAVGTAAEANSSAPGGLAYAPVASPFTGYVTPSAAGFQQVTMDPSIVTGAGAGAPHANIMPVLTLSYIICINGIFPDSQ